MDKISGIMRRFRLVGWSLFLIGLVLLTILLVEEFSNNLNYYYKHQVNFVLLFGVGTILSAIGFVILWGKNQRNNKSPLLRIKMTFLHSQKRRKVHNLKEVLRLYLSVEDFFVLDLKIAWSNNH